MTKKNKKISPDTKLKTNAFADAARGLIYISETDADILLFVGTAASEVTAAEIRKQTGAAADDKIETVDPAVFFERLTTIKEWFGDAEIDRAGRFLRLKEELMRDLTDLQVFRVGTIRVDIYIVGIDSSGRLAGVKTKAVET